MLTNSAPVARISPSVPRYVIGHIVAFVLLTSVLIYSTNGIHNGKQLWTLVTFLLTPLLFLIYSMIQYARVDVHKRSFLITYPFRPYRKRIQFRANRVQEVELIKRPRNTLIRISYQEEDRISKNDYHLNSFNYKELEALAEALDQIGMEVTLD